MSYVVRVVCIRAGAAGTEGGRAGTPAPQPAEWDSRVRALAVKTL